MKIVPIIKCVSSGQSGKHSFRCKLSTKCYITTKKCPKLHLFVSTMSICLSKGSHILLLVMDLFTISEVGKRELLTLFTVGILNHVTFNTNIYL